MSNSINWHRDCQFNLYLSIVSQKKMIKNMLDSLDDMELNFKFKQKQINEAIKKGKKSFDSDRFMKNKKDLLSQQNVEVDKNE